jgi:hypothetical protein
VTESTTRPARPARLPIFVWAVGLVGHLVMLVWFAASGLVAPLWAVGGLLAVWAVLLLIGLRLRRRRPALMLLIPVVDIGVWVAVINAGERFLGWTA